MYPSTYGEPFVSCEDRAARLLEQDGMIRQGEALTELSDGFDSYRDGYRRALDRMIGAGTAHMVWDRAGYPYYVSPARHAELTLTTVDGVPVLSTEV